MEYYDFLYKQALSQTEVSIENAFNAMPVLITKDISAIERSPSSLDAWDYCYSIAIGLAGIFIVTNKEFALYLDEIHKAASGFSGDYDLFQTFLGKTLQHKGDHIDSLNGTFKNRNGENAYGLFHRLLWGHDILSIANDNPFVLMLKQKGLSGILQTVQHLLADTASKQGLPLPGSAFLDIVDENGKTSNYLIRIAQKLSEESYGNKMKAQEIYAHLATIRAQDVVAGVVVRGMSELYFKMRGITDAIRCCEIRLIAYAVNFFGEAIVGCTKQNGVPYINTPLATAMGASFANFCYLNASEIRKLGKVTAGLSESTQKLLAEEMNKCSTLPSINNTEACLNSYQQAEQNIDELIAFLEENKE